MAYQLYRNTTLGNSLQESLDELIQVRVGFTVWAISLIKRLVINTALWLLCRGTYGQRLENLPIEIKRHWCSDHMGRLFLNVLDEGKCFM